MPRTLSTKRSKTNPRVIAYAQYRDVKGFHTAGGTEETNVTHPELPTVVYLLPFNHGRKDENV